MLFWWFERPLEGQSWVENNEIDMIAAVSGEIRRRSLLRRRPLEGLKREGRFISQFSPQCRSVHTKMPIVSVKARQIFDSRGNPTVEVDLVTDKGLFRAAVPSGASTGTSSHLSLL